MNKVFLSYTTLDKDITIDLLKTIKNKIENICSIFIHLLANDSRISQEDVIKELHCSDLMILLETDRIEESRWVQIELAYAERDNIPLLRIKPSNLLSLDSYEIEKLIKDIGKSTDGSRLNYGRKKG
jgi:hypothetical protein